MLVAGLLVALRVGACPEGYVRASLQLAAVCCEETGCGPNMYSIDEAPIGVSTKDALCYPASEEHPCCFNHPDGSGATLVGCYPRTHASLLQVTEGTNGKCTPAVYTYADGIYSVDCFPPAIDEGPNEAETGVIVVVSVIAVAAVAGAVAVCRAST